MDDEGLDAREVLSDLISGGRKGHQEPAVIVMKVLVFRGQKRHAIKAAIAEYRSAHKMPDTLSDEDIVVEICSEWFCKHADGVH